MTWERWQSKTTGLAVSLKSGAVFNPRSYCHDLDIGEVGVYLSKPPVCLLNMDPLVQFTGYPIAWDISASRSATGSIDTFTIDWGGETDLGNISNAPWSGAKSGLVSYPNIGEYIVTAYVTDLLGKNSKEVELTVEIVAPIERVYIATTDAGLFLMDNGDEPAQVAWFSDNQLKGRGVRLDPATRDLPADQQWVWFIHADGLSNSQDGGASWTHTDKDDLGQPVNLAGDAPAPQSSDLDQIGLWFDAHDPRRLYLLRTTTAPNKRAWLYVSDDYGQTWSNYQVNI